MKREEMLKRLDEEKEDWDVIIIGGGATGLGCAVDSASRGFKTLLLEQSDFAKASSSRSTKLIHGGLRYLEQGNISLVTEALQERGILCQNAPHLIHHLPFLVPTYKWWEGPFYGIGLKVYDILAGKLGLEPSKVLTRRQTINKLPNLETKDLRGGVVYYDGQFDDSRLAITLAKTAIEHGGVCVNYMQVTSLLKEKGRCVGVRARDLESKKHYTLKAKVVINATGIFIDKIMKLDHTKAKKIVVPSQGIHIILPKQFLKSNTAILVPHTDDKRVVFIIPWHKRVLIGTTDTEVSNIQLEPKPLHEEVTFLLKLASKYLHKAPKKKDILSVYAGIRPLIKEKEGASTSEIARDHKVFVSKSKLVTVAGGKWTIYRKMAEDALDKAIGIANLPKRKCITENLRLHGYLKDQDPTAHWSAYGSQIKKLRSFLKTHEKYKTLLHPKLPYYKIEVLWAVKEEMARSVEDVLSRRTRALLLDAKASIEVAPFVAHVLAKELGKGVRWEKAQIKAYEEIAKNYFAK